METNKHKDLVSSHCEIYKDLFLQIFPESTSRNLLRAKTAVPIEELLPVDCLTKTATWHTNAPLTSIPSSTDNIRGLLVFNLLKPSGFFTYYQV
jgi:hypothetical protein